MSEAVLREAILNCRKCGEYTESIIKSGKNKGQVKREYTVPIQSKTAIRLTDSSICGVPGSGPIDAPYLWIGEAPGENEDRIGEGFVGRSGQYLKERLITRLAEIDLDDCRFANTIRCHPAENRDPYKNEIDACMPFLLSEIAIVDPKVIFTIGRIATKTLLGISLAEGHGKVYDWNGYPVMPLYHPAGVNRAVSAKVLEWDYRNISRRLNENLDDSGKLKKPKEYNLELGDTAEKFAVLLEQLSQVQEFAFDIECDEPDWVRNNKSSKNVDPIQNKLIGFSIAYRLDETIRAWYIPTSDYADVPLGNFDLENSSQVPHVLLALLQPHFERCEVFMHNSKYEIQSLKKYGLRFRKIFDTILAAYSLREEQVGLKPLTKATFGITLNDINSIIDLKKHVLSEAPLAQVFPYGCNDSIYTLLYAEYAKSKFDDGERRYFEDTLMKLLPWVIDSEYEGIELDIDRIESLKPLIKSMLRGIEKEVFDLYKEKMGESTEFNLRSGDQTAKVLFEDLKLSPTKLTPSKSRYSVAAGDLESIRHENPIVGKLIDFNSLSTINSTFISGMEKHIHPKTFRVHPSFNQIITLTSRGSSSGPNIQNIPARDIQWKVIREIIIGDEVGHEIVAIDQSQIELRWAGHLSQDVTMMKIFNDGEVSIHENTCREIYDITPSHADWDYYYKGSKNGNFAALYGAEARKLAQTLECSLEVAQKFLKEHRRLYPQFWQWADAMIIFAKNYGYVETHFGFKRYLPGITSRNYHMRREAERHAVNTPVQGGSAGHIQQAMAEIMKMLNRHKINARMILQVHDELVFSCAREHVKYLIPNASKIMETIVPLSVPTPVEAEVGPNWGQLVPYEEWEE